MRIVFAQAYNLMDMGFSISLSVASIKKKKKKKEVFTILEIANFLMDA